MRRARVNAAWSRLVASLQHLAACLHERESDARWRRVHADGDGVAIVIASDEAARQDGCVPLRRRLLTGLQLYLAPFVAPNSNPKILSYKA